MEELLVYSDALQLQMKYEYHDTMTAAFPGLPSIWGLVPQRCILVKTCCEAAALSGMWRTISAFPGLDGMCSRCMALTRRRHNCSDDDALDGFWRVTMIIREKDNVEYPSLPAQCRIVSSCKRASCAKGQTATTDCTVGT